MTIKEIIDQKEWDSLFTGPHFPFVQSYAWGEFQRAKGFPVFRLRGSEKNNRIHAQWIVHPLPIGFVYWYAPYGPTTTVQPSTSSYYEIIASYLRAICSQAALHPIFLRIEPPLEVCYESQALALKATLELRNTSSVQVKDTRMIDLTKSDNILLSEMHPKTRYNIKLAERKSVVVHRGNQYIEDFITLNKETTARDGFISHPDDHYRLMVRTLPDNMVSVYAAEYDGKIIASNIVITWGDTASYVHGASASSYRNVMAPHLLQWRQIQDAKEAGSTFYDFWGIATSQGQSEKSKAWAGITRFKSGFGGFERNYIGALDLPVRKKLYTLYNVLRRYR